MKIKNFEAFAKKVAKRLNTKIVRVSSDRIWFDNYYYIDFDDDEFIYIADYSNDFSIPVFSAFAYTYNTQKDFFHDFEMVISATSAPEAAESTEEPEELEEPEATEVPEEPDETDYNTIDEKRQTYLSVYRDLQQTLTHLRKCKTLRTYDRCIGQYIKKLNGMHAEKKISYSMLYFTRSKISMQNAESGIWASEYERATGYHKSRRYNKNRVDA